MARRSADSEMNGKSSPWRRSDRFLAGLASFNGVTFVSHVHPDPEGAQHRQPAHPAMISAESATDPAGGLDQPAAIAASPGTGIADTLLS